MKFLSVILMSNLLLANENKTTEETQEEEPKTEPHHAGDEANFSSQETLLVTQPSWQELVRQDAQYFDERRFSQ
ncbi:MAG: hypothetical protein WCK49_09910 [Myxococcaceae bacterium]